MTLQLPLVWFGGKCQVTIKMVTQKSKLKGDINMTNAQKLIMKYVNKNFVSESVHIDFLNDECVKVTDQTGDELKLTVNLFGDIMDADTRKIYAIGNVSHNLAALMLDPTQMPTDWTELERI